MTEIIAVTALAMLLDLITGVAKAVKSGTVMSGKMREGLWHKAGFVGLVLMSGLVEYAAGHIPTQGVEIPGFVELCAMADAVPFVVASCAFIVLTELVSITENLCELSPAIKDSPIGKIFANIKAMEGKE